MKLVHNFLKKVEADFLYGNYDLTCSVGIQCLRHKRFSSYVSKINLEVRI